MPLPTVGSIYRRVVRIIHQDVVHLQNHARREQLSSGEARNLIGYAKLLKELQQIEKAERAEEQAKADAVAKGQSDEALLDAVTTAPETPHS